MAQFDVHEVRGGLALDCQSDRLSRLPTRFVIPLEPFTEALNVDDWLNPVFDVRGRRMIMATQLAGTIPARELGGWVASFRSDRDKMTIQQALDSLFAEA